jgi:hypothetical protein
MALPEGGVPLVVGTALALGALTLVLSPLLGAVDESPREIPRETPAARKARERELANTAVDALREIEFDRETGKLSDTDYAELKQRYTREALAELRAADAAAATSSGGAPVRPSATAVDDAVEAAIQRARTMQKQCGVCGPRPEPDATYCSSCGRYLPEQCGTCGARVDLVGSRFCSGCGTHLAAA